MAIKIHTKADVAQKVEQLPCKDKVAGSKPAVSTNGVHMGHCNQGDYLGSCKYGEDDCPAIIRPKPDVSTTYADIQGEMRRAVESIILRKHKERLAYNAAYQRDLRTIKRLGLAVTVKQYRESLK